MTNIGDYLLAEVMLWLIYIVMVASIVVTVYSLTRSAALKNLPVAVSNRVPRRQVAWGMLVFTIVLVTVTCLLGSAQPMLINGVNFNDHFWLKVADGLITSSVVMMAVAGLCVVYGMTGINRRWGTRKER